jgi:hypothetical protein
MKKIACLIGILMICSGTIGWYYAGTSNFFITIKEFQTILLCGIPLILPELIHQIQQFLHSGEEIDSWN